MQRLRPRGQAGDVGLHQVHGHGIAHLADGAEHDVQRLAPGLRVGADQGLVELRLGDVLGRDRQPDGGTEAPRPVSRDGHAPALRRRWLLAVGEQSPARHHHGLRGRRIAVHRDPVLVVEEPAVGLQPEEVSRARHQPSARVPARDHDGAAARALGRPVRLEGEGGRVDVAVAVELRDRVGLVGQPDQLPRLLPEGGPGDPDEAPVRAGGVEREVPPGLAGIPREIEPVPDLSVVGGVVQRAVAVVLGGGGQEPVLRNRDRDLGLRLVVHVGAGDPEPKRVRALQRPGTIVGDLPSDPPGRRALLNALLDEGGVLPRCGFGARQQGGGEGQARDGKRRSADRMHPGICHGTPNSTHTEGHPPDPAATPSRPETALRGSPPSAG